MNPFQLVYGALWDLLLAHPHFKSVAPGNLIRFDSQADSNPLKRAIAQADLPEIMLQIDSTTTNLYNTSSSSQITRSYSWILSSGDFRYSKIMGELEWALVCAMANWPKLCTLVWKHQTFVKRVGIPSVQTGLSDAERNRNITGWAALWRLEVEMHFKTSDLIQGC